MRSASATPRARWITRGWFVPLTVCLLFTAVDAAFAQRRAAGGGGRSRGQSGSTGVTQRQTTEVQSIDQPGPYRGQISKFEAQTSDKDENLIGVLTIRPMARGSKTLKVQVRKTEDFRVSIGGHAFEPEACADILWKGLYCTAEWDWLKLEGEDEKKKPTTRELRSLTFDTMPVEGTIEEMEGEFITLKAKPKDGTLWPDSPPPSSKAGSSSSTKVPSKSLRLKVFDEVSAFVDAASQALDVGDFSPKQQIQAVVVYGKKQGVLIELRSMTAEERKEAEQKKPAERGPAPRVGPRGGGRLRR